MGPEAEIERAAQFRVGLRRFLRQTEEVTSRGGLSSQRYDLLLFVQAAPGHRTTTSDLTRTLQLGQPAVTELVKQADRAGLVRRTPDDLDRRRIWIELTPSGRDLLLASLQALGDARNELASAITEAQRAYRLGY
ncbi:MAG: MarR family transcriptional regulator [Propionibacteriales bacterium]|nr:MarR family transcriptional regulator [Propionibacteriales bacterium]